MFEIIKMLLCVHVYEYEQLDRKSLHSQMVCRKCSKKKYCFEC